MPNPGPPDAAVQPPALAEQFVCELRVDGRAAAWVLIRGELDLASSSQFEHSLENALRQARLVIVELRELTFTARGSVRSSKPTAGHRPADAGLCWCSGPAQVQRLLTLVGVADRLEIVDLENGQVPAKAIASRMRPFRAEEGA